MRAPLVRWSCLLSLLIASSASAVSMAWTPIGNPGNPADTVVSTGGTTGYGSVPYAYDIGTYDVTNAQYTEFLNAKAAIADPLGLYNQQMASPTDHFYGIAGGGITRSGSLGSYTYSTIAGRENMPVNFVSFYDALRFANWMNNGQGIGDTETGSYTLLGGTAKPINWNTVARNPVGATIVLTSENEWYKAAYYNSASTSYFAYPAGSNTLTTCTAPTASPNHANCNNAVGDLTPVGSYAGSASPYGTFDQGGNVFEWNESIVNTDSNRGMRGGSYSFPVVFESAEYRVAGNQSEYVGFRLAMIPEPGTGLLVFAGLLGLAGWRRVSA
jgi:sulfatase modifying factor 1